jgi:O-antigen/teichoic acid export membrane protein
MTELRGSRVALTTLALAASGSTTLLFNIVLARRLSVAGFGEVARTYSIAMAVAQITMAAIAPAIAWRVAQEGSEEDRYSRARASLGVLLVAVACTSFLFPVAVLAGLAPSGRLFVAGGWLFALVYPTYFGLKVVLFALDQSRLYARLEFLSDGIFFACLLAFAVLAPREGIVTFSVAYGVFVVLAVRFIRRSSGRGYVGRLGTGRPLMRYGLLAGAATYSSVARFPLAVVITGAVAGSIAAGSVGAVIALTLPFFLVPQAAGILTFASVARSDDETHVLVRRGVRAASVWTAALVSSAIVLAPVVVPRLLGDRYAETVSLFVLLLVCLVPQLTATPVGNALAGEGAVGLSAAISIAGLIVAVTTVGAGAAYGLTEAVMGLGGSACFTGVWLLLVGRKRFGLRLSDIGAVAAVPVALAVTIAPSVPLAVGATLVLVAVVFLVRPETLRSIRRHLVVAAKSSSALVGATCALGVLLGYATVTSPRVVITSVVIGVAAFVAIQRPAQGVLCLLIVKPLVDYWVRLPVGPSSVGQLWGAAVLACAVLYLLRSDWTAATWRAPIILLIAYPIFAFTREQPSRFLINEIRLVTWLAVVLVIERYGMDALRQREILRAALASAALLVVVIAVAVKQHQYGSAYYTGYAAFLKMNSTQQVFGLAASAVFCCAIVLLAILAERLTLLWLGILVLLSAEIVLSLVRGSFVALAILLIIWMARGIYRKRGSILVATFGCGVAVVTASVLYAGVISDRLSRAAPRLAYWRPVLSDTLQHPGAILIGRGPTASSEVIQQAVGERIWSHNDFIELFATGGVVLLAVFLGFVVWLLASCCSLATSTAQSKDAREVGVLGIGVCAAWLVVASVDGALFASSSFFFALFIGLIRAMAATPKRTWIDLQYAAPVWHRAVFQTRSRIRHA